MTMNNLPQLSDILAEPSVEILTGYARKYHITVGKFIRIGRIIVVAPAVVVAGANKYPLHLNMMRDAFRNPDEEFAERCRQAAENTSSAEGLRRRPELMDAGHYSTAMSAAGLLTAVTLERQSGDFGRADAEGRQESVRIMQEYLQNPDIVVTGS